MKRLFAVAALLLASTAAQAQYTFEYGGHTIRIDPDRGTVSIPGVYDNSGRRSRRARGDEDGDRQRKPAQTEPAATAAPANAAATATAPLSPADPAAPAPPGSTPPAASVPQVLPETAAKPVAPEMVATTAPAPPPPAQAVQQANSPLGVWLTEEKEGKVRIEQCGANLCGYSVDAKSNQNGEQVLINMKPGKDSKWSGRILDPTTGSTYDSTIALQGSDTLRVQGCAFSGMFCGGQTWSRLN
jgi:uncharacterized protein (DUF2147 family)